MNLRQKYDIPNDAVITIAGTVGVGKSTMTTALANALGIASFEKVDSNRIWTSSMLISHAGAFTYKCIFKSRPRISIGSIPSGSPAEPISNFNASAVLSPIVKL